VRCVQHAHHPQDGGHTLPRGRGSGYYATGVRPLRQPSPREARLTALDRPQAWGRLAAFAAPGGLCGAWPWAREKRLIAR
jgi:hypothetical protein